MSVEVELVECKLLQGANELNPPDIGEEGTPLAAVQNVLGRDPWCLVVTVLSVQIVVTSVATSNEGWVGYA